jgi:hypothetical protein
MCRKPKSEKRAVVFRDRFHDFLVAARHQHVGDGLVERFSLGDCQHMRLVLGADIGYQSIRFELDRLAQDRTGDLDRIVKGEFVDDIDRGLVEPRQLLGELGAGRDFNFVGETSDDLAKGPDLVLAIAAGDHQIGGMPQRPRAAFSGSPLHGFVEIPKKRFLLSHFGRTLKRAKNAQQRNSCASCHAHAIFP